MAPNPKQFVFLSLQATKNTSPSTIYAVVPTPQQLLGDLTPAYQAGLKPGNVVPVYDPITGQLYGNTGCLGTLKAIDPSPTQCIPATELQTTNSVAAQNLLQSVGYPLPNTNPTQTLDNFQLLSLEPQIPRRSPHATTAASGLRLCAATVAEALATLAVDAAVVARAAMRLWCCARASPKTSHIPTRPAPAKASRRSSAASR